MKRLVSSLLAKDGRGRLLDGGDESESVVGESPTSAGGGSERVERSLRPRRQGNGRSGEQRGSNSKELVAALRGNNVAMIVATARAGVNLSMPMDNGPNGGHQTPLAFIISRCIAKIISEDAAYELVRCLLVECGVDPNVGIRMNQGGDVEYPIVMVVRHTLIKIFQLLVGHGADMRSRSTLDGKMEDCAAAAISSLIFCTRTSSRAKCMQMLTLVYERSCRSRDKADASSGAYFFVNRTDLGVYTHLSHATLCADPQVTELLLSKGCLPDMIRQLTIQDACLFPSLGPEGRMTSQGGVAMGDVALAENAKGKGAVGVSLQLIKSGASLTGCGRTAAKARSALIEQGDGQVLSLEFLAAATLWRLAGGALEGLPDKALHLQTEACERVFGPMCEREEYASTRAGAAISLHAHT